MKPITRRDIIKCSGGLAGAVAVGLPLAESTAEEQRPGKEQKLKVVVVGGHPDDPESGCGGTMARYAEQGHEVVALYLTRNEAGALGAWARAEGKTREEAQQIATAEAEAACRILGARPMFVGQIDGDTEVNRERYDQFRKLLAGERPDIVFTHWPIDSHRDHRVASLLAYDAWYRSGKKFALYYYEVMSGGQTQHFWPTHYVDITATEARKRESCFAHASQRPASFYSWHEQMNRFRGMECGCKYAEAFVRHVQSADGLMG